MSSLASGGAAGSGPAPGGLSPGFLVASPSLLDPNFARSVVLLVEHGENGSLGFVVNRPSTLSLERVLSSLGLKDDAAAPEPVAPFPLFVGGPVAQQSGWILFDPRQASEPDLTDALLLSEGVALSASRALLERMSKPTSFAGSRMLALGYAGWSGGQLDEELARGVWLPATLRADLLFDVEPDERWAAVLRREGIDPARVVSPVQRSASAKNVS